MGLDCAGQSNDPKALQTLNRVAAGGTGGVQGYRLSAHLQCQT